MQSPSSRNQPVRRQNGIALVTTVLILLLVGATALATISTSEEELKSGGRSRSVIKSLQAAEAGVQLATTRVQPPRDLSSFSIGVDGALVQSRNRSQTTPQAIGEGGLGSPPSGYSINIGSGYVNEIFAVDVTATEASLPTTELRVRLGLLSSNSGTF